MTTDKMIYLAYGSNLNKDQMSRRCPKAEPMGWINLPDYRLVFKGVADIIPAKGMTVPVGLWRITEECEEALDRYEGFPNLYRKQYWQAKDGQQFMAYVMNGYDISTPAKSYFDGIKQGYHDFGIDTAPLYEALDVSTKKDTDDGYVPMRYRTT